MSDGRRVGSVTSGTHSFFLGYPIALALVEAGTFRIGDRVVVAVRGRAAPAEIVKLPFYRGSAPSAVSPAAACAGAFRGEVESRMADRRARKLHDWGTVARDDG